MFSRPRAISALCCGLLSCIVLFAPLASAAQKDESASERDYARSFYAGFVEAREIDARCDLLEPERKAAFAEHLEYLRKDTVREYDAALIVEAEDVGKRFARDPQYLDCGQAAMDRIEDRYERIETLVLMDRRMRETPEGRAQAADAERIRQLVAEKVAADTQADDAPEVSEAEQNQSSLDMLLLSQKILNTEIRCKYLDEPLHGRLLTLEERMTRALRGRIQDAEAIAKVESAASLDTDCNAGQAQTIRGIAGQIEDIEAMVVMTEKIDEMMSTVERSQQAAAAADLSVPLPPPPANRPKPLTKAQKRKAKYLEFYASRLRTVSAETRCRFLSEPMHGRVLRAESRSAEQLRTDIADPAAVGEIDAATAAESACGDAQRADVERAAAFVESTEEENEIMDAMSPRQSP